MYFLVISLFLPMINALVTVQIHRASLYRPLSACAFLRNASWSTDASIQSCIWECVYEHDCQTAVYFNNDKVCSMFAEFWQTGSIEPSGDVRASVVCYRKDHEPIITCSSSATPNQEEETTIPNMMMSTSRGTTTPVSLASSFWSFDNNFLDGTSIFDGTGVRSPSFVSPGITGYGYALSINGSSAQYVTVPTYRNLSYTSFTVEMWIYPTFLPGSEHGIFGQHQSSNKSLTLHLMIRNYSLYMGFYGDDVKGSTTLIANTWYHATFVYDYSSKTQKIFLNGNQDVIHMPSGPYLGTSGSISIGMVNQTGSPTYFTGYIDQVSLVMRSKNITEVLNDATLATWHSFDGGSYYDSGPNGLNGTAVNVTVVTGRVNEALSFNSNSSYYQVAGFVLLGTSNRSFSIALWVYRVSMDDGLLVRLSEETNGQGRCVDLMGFSSTGQVVVTSWGGEDKEVLGPVLLANVWTHVVHTYSITNGVRLYVNGTLTNSTGPTPYITSGLVGILTLANPLQGITISAGGTCNTQSIVPSVYYGYLDEFHVYSRELNAMDVYALANP